MNLAAAYITDEVETAEEALAGARDIVAETIADHAPVRQGVREKALHFGVLHAEKIPDAADEKSVYSLYYAYEFRVDRLRPHQVLALNRGESEKVLKIHVEVAETDWQPVITRHFQPDARSPFASYLQAAGRDAAERLLLPAIERDVRRALTEEAETHAIHVFAENLRALLGQPPLSGHTVLGHRPRFPHRLQSRGHRRNRQAAGHDHHLPARAAETLEGSPQHTARAGQKAPSDPDFHWQRHRLARIRTTSRRAD